LEKNSYQVTWLLKSNLTTAKIWPIFLAGEIDVNPSRDLERMGEI